MPTTRRSRTVADDPLRVWETVSDPYHLPRWWPHVERVENVTGEHFTEVLTTERGRSVRADFRIVDSRAPEHRAWEQELAGSPFERIMMAARTDVRLAAEGAGTRVTIVVRQDLRGTARFGGFVVRRATRRLLDDALTALESLHGA
ncbi:MAG TPA: SRPBCC family protein [Solirubrobacteraceae bacterium]